MAIRPGTAFQIAHDERGIAEAVERLQSCTPLDRARSDGRPRSPAGGRARRRQLIERLTAEKNRLRLAARPIQTRLRAHVARLEQELATTNTDLTATMCESPIWREQEEFLRSVPGVGPMLTTTLFANLRELGTLTRKEVAA